MRRQLTCSTLLVNWLLQAGREFGGAVDDLPALVGVSARQLGDVDGRVPHQAIIALWVELAKRLADDRFGLRLSQRAPGGLLSVLEHSLRRAPDLGEAWRRLLRYQRLTHDSAGLRLEERGDSVFLRFVPPVSEEVPHHVAEWALASALLLGRRLTATPLHPRCVRFTHPPPSELSEHHKVFGQKVFFLMPCCEVELDSACLRLAVKAGDVELAAVMERYVEERLRHIPNSVNLAGQVQRLVYQHLESGVPSAGTIARSLRLSERSLLRHLQQEGVSYRQIIDQVRKDLAAVYLHDRSLKLTEVAFLLGFSELSAFHRAYRRWTGHAPRAEQQSRS